MRLTYILRCLRNWDIRIQGEYDMTDNRAVLVMYDVRGIQNYIFKTSKVKDAIGASAIVEDIIENAIAYACKTKDISDSDIELEWCNTDGPIAYTEKDRRVQVLYIGGGNAYLIYESKELAVEISRIMARYTIDNTYSLQLAVAITDKTDSYKDDYRRLNEEMIRIKERMVVSKPLDALPIMEVEKKTGFPITSIEKYKDSLIKLSTESDLKRRAGKSKRNLDGVSEVERILDSYTTRKGSDSMIAIVHIDGNNMGSRIRGLVEGIDDYKEAISLMRTISYNINNSYKAVFNNMADHYNNLIDNSQFGKKDNMNCFVMKILTAGDDITYVCNAKIAIATVEYFVKHIMEYGMLGMNGEKKNRFSVCAGIAYINSHFPFNIGYAVAEECCNVAKKRAKEKGNLVDGEIGNWLDFQVCKNIHTLNLELTRNREYITRTGEKLYKRPYYIKTTDAFKRQDDNRDRREDIESFKEEMRIVNGDGKKGSADKKVIGRSFAKRLRNTYPIGEARVDELASFLRSRVSSFPDDLYYTDRDGNRTAIYYDALEMMDYYVDTEN